MSSRVIINLVLLLFSFTTYARELSDLNIEIVSAKRGGEAKQEALDQATEQATRRLAEELLGPEKAASSWNTAGPKLLKSSARYVVFIKAGAPVETPEGSKVAVQLRLSPDNLESLLREMGLFAGGSVRLLPLITVVESKGSKYSWWADAGEERTLAQEYHKRLFQHLNAHFKGKSVYVLDPLNTSFRMSVPAAYRTEILRREDQAMLGQYLKADVVLTGTVNIVKARSDGPEQRIDYNLQLWQSKSGRNVAEVQRTETASSDVPKVIAAVMDPADKKVFGELAGKLSEVVGSGNLNLGVVRVIVNGSLNFRQQNELKKQLGEVREIRALKERLFEPQRVTYEAETQVGGSDLGRALGRVRFSGFQVAVDSSQDNSLVLSVRATSAQ